MDRQLKSILGLVILAALGFVCGVLVYSGLSSGSIPENTWVGPLYLGGRTRSEAIELLKWLDGSIRQREVLLDVQGHVYRVQSQDLNVRINMEEAKRLVDEFVGSHNLISRVLDSVRSAELDIHRPFQWSDRDAMDLLCEQLAAAIDRPAINARYDITSQMFIPETLASQLTEQSLCPPCFPGFSKAVL